MTKEELARYDGREGRPAYVAVSGSVYDVSTSPMWKDGNHVDAHQAGRELTEELKSAPHVRAVVERFPVVGQLEAEPPQSDKKSLPLPLVIGLAVVALLVLIWLLK